ncbi:DUF2867 domain-containing protein [Stygiobacter electus]|uniref:DUF2867 domain-containing protein n=1 Tax=Stygiobacter electus TaxID=3032292 RepID=A0AAE3TE71_9BACT|nr:DUF2867 domain-containing protein [Stygiobacter electus]MDF1613231.1 DUF2867 domain-containing protein [Stygiobacter electus]
MKISKTRLPNGSILKSEEKSFGYLDSFQGVFFDKGNFVSISEIGRLFFSSVPNWVEYLFKIRNKIVSLLGLKTSNSLKDRQNRLDNFKFETGEQFGLFKVFSKTNNEVILGEDDKHLNFKVSLFIDKQTNNREIKTLTISTSVSFKNWFGNLYFFIVKPFHKIIVPTMLKRIIKNIEGNNNR